MAQQPQWEDVPLDAPQWEDIPVNAPAAKPKSLKDYGWEMGIATVPSVIGDFFGPVGSIVGGGIGELGRQIYAGEGINPALIGTEAVLNIVPGLGKAERGLYGAVKHGVKSGAFQGLVGSVPRKMAEEGILTEEGGLNLPSLEEAALQTGFGGLFGGPTAGIMHGLGKIGKTQAKPPAIPEGLGQPNLPFTDMPPVPPPGGPPLTHEASKALPLFDQPAPSDRAEPLPFEKRPQFPTERIPLKYPTQDELTVLEAEDKARGITSPFRPPLPKPTVAGAVADAGGGAGIVVGEDGIINISGKNIDAINSLKRKGFTIVKGSAQPNGDIKMQLTEPEKFYGAEEPEQPQQARSWSDRPNPIGLHGDEAIPDHAFQVDEGKSTLRDWSEHFLPEEQGGKGQGDILNPMTREEINQSTETNPEGFMDEIATVYPHLLDEARVIYNETDPEQISQNLARWSAEEKAVGDKWNQAYSDKFKHGIPVPPELQEAMRRANKLHMLAQAKYERAGRRAVTGEPMFAGIPPEDGPPKFGEPGREPLPGEQTGRVAPFKSDPNTRPYNPEEHGQPWWWKYGSGMLSNWPPTSLRAALRDVSDDEIAKLVDEHNSGVRRLTNEEVLIVENEWGRRYPQGSPMDSEPPPGPSPDINAHINDLMEQLRTTTDFAARKELMDRIQRLQQVRKAAQPPRSMHLGEAIQPPFGPPVKSGFPDEAVPGLDQPVPLTQGQQDLPTGPYGMENKPLGIDAIDLGPTPTMDQFTQPRLRGIGRGIGGKQLTAPFDPRYPDPTSGRRQFSGGKQPPGTADAWYDMNPGDLLKRAVDLINKKGQLTNEEIQELSEITRLYNDHPDMMRTSLGDVLQKRVDDANAQLGQNKSARLSDPLFKHVIRSDYEKAAELIDSTTDPATLKSQYEALKEWAAEAQKDGDFADAEARSNLYEQAYDKYRAIAGEPGAAPPPKPPDEPQQAQAPGQPYPPATTQELAGAYDSLRPKGYNRHFVNDGAGKYTPLELAKLENSPMLRNVAGAFERMLDEMHTWFDADEMAGTTKKFGFHIADEGLGGFSASSQRVTGKGLDLATAINPFDAFRSGLHRGTDVLLTPRQAARRFVHLIKHEFVHNLAREEGQGYTWAFTHLDTRFPRTREYEDEIYSLITDKHGRYLAEVPELLREYLASRGRPGTKRDFFAGPSQGSSPARIGPTGISGGHKPYGAGASGGGTRPPATRIAAVPVPPKPPEDSVMRELYNLARGITTSLDISAPLRQGLPLISTKEWWKAWKPMVQSWGSDKAYAAVNKSIEQMTNFRPRVDPLTGRKMRSIAEESGIRLSDLSKGLMGREESMMSSWAESGKFFGLGKDTALGKGWAKSVGAGIKKSNRAYTAYLNKLRADTFNSLMDDAMKSAAGDKMMDPFQNKELARQIGEFVMTATGRGPLKTELPHLGRDPRTGKLKLGMKTYSLEQNAQLLTDTMFSPRLMASRVRMLNPGTYLMANPYVRKQYLKSLATVAGFGLTMNTVAGMFGAETNTDTNSSDFGKMKFGNTRIDPWGGFQQFGVAFSRLLTGGYTSSGTGEEFELGQGYRAPTRGDVLEQFATNKLHPMLKFGYDVLTASEYKPFRAGDRLVQMYVPLIAQDAIELASEAGLPGLAALPLVAAGMGTQTYEGGQQERGIVPPEYDYEFTGGAPQNELDYLIPDIIAPPQ